MLDAAKDAAWVVMSGSLPPGVPASWYGDVVALLAGQPCRIAVDTSDAPLAALVGSLDRGAPDLIKPNAEELAGVLGYSRRRSKMLSLKEIPGPWSRRPGN